MPCDSHTSIQSSVRTIYSNDIFDVYDTTNKRTYTLIQPWSKYKLELQIFGLYRNILFQMEMILFINYTNGLKESNRNTKAYIVNQICMHRLKRQMHTIRMRWFALCLDFKIINLISCNVISQKIDFGRFIIDKKKRERKRDKW